MNLYEHMMRLLNRYHSAGADGRRLSREMMMSGFNVVQDFIDLKVGPPWVWSQKMESFYCVSDAFVYELLVWHHTPGRIRWRNRISARIAELFPHGASVLSLGDGIGYDSCTIAMRNPELQVTSFEFEGHSSAFAQRMIEALKLSNKIKVLHQLDQIPGQAFDVVLCLDVIEHVPEPAQVLTNIASYLKPHGRLFLSEAFGAVDPSHPTHLASNLKYVGRTVSLCRKVGLYLRGAVVDRVLEFSRAKPGGAVAGSNLWLREVLRGYTARRYAIHRFKTLFEGMGIEDLSRAIAFETLNPDGMV